MGYTLHHTPDFIFIRYHQVLDEKLLHSLAAEEKTVEELYPVVPPRIADFRPVQQYLIDWSGFMHHAERRKQRQFPNAFRSALLVSTDLAFGYMRAFQTLNTNPQIDLQIFRDLPAACAWTGIAYDRVRAFAGE